MRKTTLLALLGVILLFAQDSHAEKRSYTTVRADQAPRIDGHVDEAVWKQVNWSSEFLQREPVEGELPTGQTAFKILYDDENLYLAYHAKDPEPEKMASILSRRDHFPGDWVEVNIDSYHDGRTAFSFTASLSGTQGDELISEDGHNWDPSWDPIWDHAAQPCEDGWTAELRIPLSQLRYNGEEEQVWGIQVQRRIHRLEERSCWQVIPKDENGWVSKFGELRGIRNIPAQRQVELLPYAVSKGETFPAEGGNPFADGSRGEFSGGLDGKIGVTSDLTLDFTVNPDFGQVEADPSQVNLTAFETFYQEKRPFFIEGKNIFELRLAPSVAYGTHTRDRLFYSRRIGRSPHYRADWYEEGYVDQPLNTSILGAFKLTGKTDGGLSVGVMESVTGREEAEIELNGERSKVTVEPKTNYFVGRLQQDLRGGETRLGGMFTAVNRSIDTEEVEFLHEAAYAGALDFFHYFNQRNYYVTSNLFASRVSGSEEAMLDTQTAPARYYQRPDNDRVDVDSTLTALTGHAGSFRMGKSQGSLNFDTGLAWRSPGFEINDLGFVRNADELNQFSWVGYNIRRPFSVFNRMSFNFNQWNDFDLSGRHLYMAFNLNSNAQFKNNWRYNYSVSRENERISNWELRGGPSMRMPGNFNMDANLNTDHSKVVSGGAGSWFPRLDDDAGGGHGFWSYIAWRPSNALRIEMNPSLSWRENDMQYVSATDFEGDPRYIYGSISQRTFDASLRIDYSLTPNLTVQFYGAPFIAAGEYDQFKRVTDPMAGAYEDRYAELGELDYYSDAEEYYVVDEDGDDEADYYFYDPSFNIRDFNSNLVIRWAYSPGSSLYLVWSQSRFGYDQRGEFALGNDLDELFNVEPHNVFLLKINRWINL